MLISNLPQAIRKAINQKYKDRFNTGKITVQEIIDMITDKVLNELVGKSDVIDIFENNSANLPGSARLTNDLNKRLKLIEEGTGKEWKLIGAVVYNNAIAIDSEMYKEFLICLIKDGRTAYTVIPSELLGDSKKYFAWKAGSSISSEIVDGFISATKTSFEILYICFNGTNYAYGTSMKIYGR